MNKKYIFLIVAIVLIVLLVCSIWLINSNKEKVNSNFKNDSNAKVAVVYFSATGTTESVAKTISKELNADLIEIVPKVEYTSEDLNWNDTSSRTSIECNDSSSRPEIADKLDIDKYDVIYLGYPIWWGDVPHIILTFMDNYKLDGKTVIPFCTSGGTDISQSMNTLKKYNKKVNWINGKRLNTSENDIKDWINKLKY